MRFTQSEKMEIIRIVEGSELSINRTLQELGIPKRTFYNWYGFYLSEGYDGLAPKKRAKNRIWNQIPEKEKEKVVEKALEHPVLTPRELACKITDEDRRYISESSVYRILKERGLITSPAYIVMSACDSFKDKTSRPNEMWQTDFTYLKVAGWGWYYLSTVLDDYSRFIIHWELCDGMATPDVERSVDKAMQVAGIKGKKRPKLLSDNGPCYISTDLKKFLDSKGINQVHGRPCHPQTQGKIERYHRTMKNVIKLETYYSPEELKARLEEFIYYYNYLRYHEGIDNLTPASVYYGHSGQILSERAKIKEQTLMARRSEYFEEKMIMMA